MLATIPPIWLVGEAAPLIARVRRPPGETEFTVCRPWRRCGEAGSIETIPPFDAEVGEPIAEAPAATSPLRGELMMRPPLPCCAQDAPAA